ncbi:MAG: ATP-binding protein [bacterium]|nr:ATP-binding protein [bacterium]
MKVMNFFYNLWAKSIARQLLIGVSLVHALLMTFFVYEIVSSQREELHRNSVSMSENLAIMAAQTSIPWILASDFAGMEEVVRSVSRYPEIAYVMILGPDGKVLAHSDRKKVGLYVNDELSMVGLSYPYEHRILLNDYSNIDVSAPINVNSRLVGWVRIGLHQNNIARVSQLILQRGVIFTVVAICVGVVFAWLLAAGLTQALRKFIAIAGEITDGARGKRVDESRVDEVGQLAHHFNTMLCKLESSESQLRDSEERFELALRGANDALWDYDIITGKVFYSPRWKEMLGYSDDEVAPDIDAWKMRVLIEDRGKLFEIIEEALADRDVTQFSHIYRMACRNGAVLWILGRGLIVRNEDGVALRMVGTSADISRRIQAEQELIQARDRAEQATRAKTDFLANMSHEIRTPLNGIIGTTDLLRETELDQEQSELLETVQQCSSVLLLLLNNILDISKIEAGKFNLDCHAFEPLSLIKEVVRMMNPQAVDKELGISLDVHWPEGNSSWVMGDSTRLKQVMINLIGNAIKFTSSGGVSVGVSLLKANDKVASIRFSVTDTGIGIDEAKREEIFDKFTQADVSMTRSYGGSGLGLAICRHIVEEMGSRLQLETMLNVGSTFWFTLSLPMALQRAAVQESKPFETIHKPEPAVLAYDIKILLVEDVQVNRLVLGKTLTRLGCRVDMAVNGAEAVEMRMSCDYDVILMDVQMPVLNGMDATVKIREWEAANNKSSVYIIAFTASAMSETRNMCMASGMNDFIVKPVRSADLIAALESWRSVSES